MVTLRQLESNGGKQIHTKCCSNAFKEGGRNCGWLQNDQNKEEIDDEEHFTETIAANDSETTVILLVMEMPHFYCFIYDRTSSFQYSEIVRRLRQKISSGGKFCGNQIKLLLF